LFQNSFAQKKCCGCDSSGLAHTKTDKILLKKFWNTFTTAIKNNDKLKLASVINYPFICDYRVIDSTQSEDKDFKISKQQFISYEYKLFDDLKLKNEINKYPNWADSFWIVQGDRNKCIYQFEYTTVEPSKEWEGQQRFFTVERIKGRFLITSSYIVP